MDTRRNNVISLIEFLLNYEYNQLIKFLLRYVLCNDFSYLQMFIRNLFFLLICFISLNCIISFSIDIMFVNFPFSIWQCLWDNRWDFEKKVSLNSWTSTSELGGSCAFKNKRSFNLTLCRGSKRLLLRLSRIFYLEDLFLHSRLQGQEEWVSRDGGFSCLSVLISLRLISY